jgi:hypothetical protein
VITRVAREPSGLLSPARTMATGILALAAGLVLFLTFVVVAIATDNRFPHQWVFLVAAVVLVPAGVLAFLAGLIWRLVTASWDARAREASLVAQMDAATTPGLARAVQARASAVSWKRRLALAAICSPLVALVVDSAFGRYGRLLVLASFAAAAVAAVAFLGLPRRTRFASTVSTGPAPSPPPAVRQRILDEQAEMSGPWFGATLAVAAETALLWTWCHELLLAREQTVADIAARHGWTYQTRDLRAAADGTARNSLLGTYDGLPYLAFDRIRSVSHHDRERRVTGVTLDTANIVQVPFTAAFRLAVVRDSFGADVRWGHFGRAVELESGAFNDTFNVYCLDHYRARLVLNPAVMGVLMDNPGVELVMDHGLLRVTRTGDLADEQELLSLIALTARVARSAEAADVT